MKTRNLSAIEGAQYFGANFSHYEIRYPRQELDRRTRTLGPDRTDFDNPGPDGTDPGQDSKPDETCPRQELGPDLEPE